MTWNPDLYARFEAERRQPFLDLMEWVPARPYRHIVDLGCGTGTNTVWLAARNPEAHIVGVDSSSHMLQKADRSARNVTYATADIRDWAPTHPADLIVSNAALHWLPDHPTLIPHIVHALAPGGVLAFQVPANHRAPSHTAVTDVASDPAWADRVRPCLAPGSVLPLDQYRDMLTHNGLTVTAWDHTYEHRLPGADAIVDWLSGTTLHGALEALEPDERTEFRDLLRQRIAAAYGDADVVRFPFRRRFVVAADESDQTG